nr:alpha-amylase family glycosyl hydrolase [Aestuariibacter salexigens]
MPVAEQTITQTELPEYFGTREPFAAEAIYFAMTDRFVDGDPSNNYEQQGGDYPTWQGELTGPEGQTAYVGYMGGDFKGILNNADYIRDMGFTALWLTPIVDNPDQAFAGGEPIEFGGMFKDGGKTGYHGYWANNFYQVDEHYPSTDLDYKTLTQTLRDEFGIKTVFDVVANHGSPSFSMPVDQPKFGELYDIEGNLVADHQNLEPEALSGDEPLHAFFHREKDIMQLSNLDESNPAVQDYLINSYLYWIEQGADAFRIDTIKHVPHHFWKTMADRIREQHPDFFMFAESYDYNANFIAQHTQPKNGGISVLDFPGQQAMTKVFEDPDSDFAALTSYLHLTHGPYQNPYDLTTFYDNHDMRRMNASDEGFINANNWLFTSRGIPVVYQGSEIGFMRGTAEHAGNRNYYGQENIDRASQHPIYQSLKQIANVRKTTPALQRGLQVNVLFEGHHAAFYRVLQDGDTAQTALVLLNKGQTPATINVQKFVQAGQWQEQLSGKTVTLTQGQTFSSDVPANGVQVWVRDGVVNHQALEDTLMTLMANK